MEQTKKKSSRGKSRSYSKPIERALYAFAAGRCEFKGCNKPLLVHHLSLNAGNFAEKAHIRPFSPDGPRGTGSSKDRSDINGVSNLMLLCGGCHEEIDGRPDEYPIDLLKKHKKEHEDRVSMVTSLGSECRTKVIVLKANIAGQPTSASDEDVYRALFPNRWATKKPVDVIDLTGVLDRANGYSTFSETIADHVRGFYSEIPDHVSVFAIGPMPLLMDLGSRLSNKIPTDFFQLHRDTKSWEWKKEGGATRYVTSKARQGTDPAKVALVVSLSGTIDIAALSLDDKYSVYLLTLDGAIPNPGFLQTQKDHDGFREEYRRCIAQIASENPTVKEIHFFPAMPAPIAVTCGYDLLPKAHPALIIHDYDKALGGFREVHKINFSV